MAQEEVLEYNRRCAEFLGLTQYKGMLNCMYWKGGDYIPAGYQTSDLKFHSDWNWIMQVVKAIEKMEFRVEIAFNEVNLECVRPDLDRFSSHINLPDCVGYGEDLHLTKKEAVVKAINNFLIWYEQNK